MTDPDAETEPVDYDTAEAAEVYRLAYEVSVRELDGQDKSVDQVRVRVTALLALAATSGAFMVGVFSKASSADKATVWYWSLVVAGGAGFAVAVGVGAWELAPMKLKLQSSAKTIIKDYWNKGLAATLRELAHHNEDNAEFNATKIDARHTGLKVLIAAVMVELVLWALLVGLTA